MTLTGEWTSEERLYVIGWIAAGIRYRNMNQITAGNFPNSETIMGIATSSPDSLAENVSPDQIYWLIEDLKAQGIYPKTIDECKEQFEQMQGERFESVLAQL